MNKIEVKRIYDDKIITIVEENSEGFYDFSNLDLSDAKFEHLNLNKAKFDNTKLNRAIFNYCSLEGASFFKSIITDTEFYYSSIIEGLFIETTIKFTRFKSCDLYKSLFLEVDICNNRLHNCSLEECRFESSKAINLALNNVYIRHAIIPQYIIDNCSLYDTDISGILNSRYISISGLGRAKRTTVYCLDTGKIKCGCFTGTIKEFKKEVKRTHKHSIHRYTYLSMVKWVIMVHKIINRYNKLKKLSNGRTRIIKWGATKK